MCFTNPGVSCVATVFACDCVNQRGNDFWLSIPNPSGVNVTLTILVNTSSIEAIAIGANDAIQNLPPRNETFFRVSLPNIASVTFFSMRFQFQDMSSLGYILSNLQISLKIGTNGASGDGLNNYSPLTWNFTADGIAYFTLCYSVLSDLIQQANGSTNAVMYLSFFNAPFVGFDVQTTTLFARPNYTYVANNTQQLISISKGQAIYLKFTQSSNPFRLLRLNFSQTFETLSNFTYFLFDKSDQMDLFPGPTSACQNTFRAPTTATLSILNNGTKNYVLNLLNQRTWKEVAIILYAPVGDAQVSVCCFFVSVKEIEKR